MSDPLVGVVIPCYNQGRFLSEAVASVLAQTLDRWELVIVDDGSSDDTAAVAQRLIRHHSPWRISLIRQGNQGLGASRNRGIAATSAPYLLALDADDLLAPELLARTAALLDAHEQVGFVTTNAHFFGAERTLWSGGEPSGQRLIYDCRMIPAGTLFRRSAWVQGGGFYEGDELWGYEDWDFWLRLSEAGWQGRLVAEPLVLYRRSPGSMLSQAQRRDLHVRARLVLRHPALYPASFQPWARATLREEGRPGAAVLWWRWFLWYAGLVGRHAPRELPKTLLRPLFKGLSPGQQMYARRVARLLRLSSGGK